MSKIDLSKIFGDQVSELSEEQVTQICGRIEDIVESRVKAKIDLQTEIAEAEAKEKYDSLLKESTEDYTSTISDMEEALLEKASSYQETIVEKAESFVVEFVEQKEKEIEEFQEGLVDKLDKYLELELEKNIPQEFHEAAAKVAVMEPIVQDVMESFKKNYIKCDTESFGLLKEAHSEITDLRAQLSEATKEQMEINHKFKEAERSMKISKVCEGLSTAQMEKAQKLLEGVDVDQIDAKYEMIRDIVLEDVQATSDKEVVSESATSESTEGRAGDSAVSKVVSEETTAVETEEAPKKVVTESTIDPEAQRVMGYAAEFNKRWGKK
jgi:hypothetical protein